MSSPTSVAAAPVPRSLRAGRVTVDKVLDPSYWSRLCPWLHVDGTLEVATYAHPSFAYPSSSSSSWDAWRATAEGDSAAVEAASSHLRHQGFLKLVAEGETGAAAALGSRLPPIQWPPGLVDALALGVERLWKAGHPASCILAYDEAWFVQASLRRALAAVTGGNVPLGDWYVFAVNMPDGEDDDYDDDEEDDGDGDEGEGFSRASASAGSGAGKGNGVAAGANKAWPPHRDRPMHDAGAIAASFREDGSSMYTTVWVPLTDAAASPEGSCLYCIPAPLDPGYAAGDEAADDPLRAAITCPSDFQKILALPVPKGSVLTFTHRLLHWGSAPLAPVSGQEPQPPRLALSLAYSDPSFERPYLTRPGAAVPARGGEGDESEAKNETKQEERDRDFPCHAARMGLVSAQGIVYDHQVPLTARRAHLYADVFHRARDHFDAAYADKVESTVRWASFKKKAASNGGQFASLRRAGPPSQEDIGLLFCALASAREGLDAEAYI
jgi:hypothetical protein